MKQEGNAVQVDLELLNRLRNALAKASNEGDYLKTAAITGKKKENVWAYMTGRRPIETETGLMILGAFSDVVTGRKNEEKKAALIAQAEAL